mgnify:CR=1 FL=1
MPQRRLLASSLAGLLALVGSPWLDRASLAQAQDGAECEEEAGCEAADAEWEAGNGLSFVSLNALLMKRYMYEYGWEKEHFAPFAVHLSFTFIC